MNTLLVVVVVLVAAHLAHLARLVRRDGLGTVPPPRSHVAELGTAVDRELRR